MIASWWCVINTCSSSPSFLSCVPQMLIVFCSRTNPVYFSFESNLEIASRFHLAFLVGESTPDFSRPSAILLRVSPSRYHSKIQRTTSASARLTVRPPLGEISYPYSNGSPSCSLRSERTYGVPA